MNIIKRIMNKKADNTVRTGRNTREVRCYAVVNGIVMPVL